MVNGQGNFAHVMDQACGETNIRLHGSQVFAQATGYGGGHRAVQPDSGVVNPAFQVIAFCESFQKRRGQNGVFDHAGPKKAGCLL
jgi:hypothetical protein